MEIAISGKILGCPGHLSAGVRDLWQAKDYEQFKAKYFAPVASHSVIMPRVMPYMAFSTGLQFLADVSLGRARLTC